jgi:hypothetical protein
MTDLPADTSNLSPVYRLIDRGFAFATEIINLSADGNFNIAQCDDLASAVERYLPGRIHAFADRLTRNLACIRSNSGLFTFAPMTEFEAEYRCAAPLGCEFAIGPAMSRYGFREVSESVLQIQIEISRAAGSGSFVMQIDQVEYWVAVNANVVRIVADNHLALRDQGDVEATQAWLKSRLEALTLDEAD